MRWPSLGPIACGAVDLICTLSLLAIGTSQGAANLCGAILGYLLLLAIRVAAGGRSESDVALTISIALFALALRGGIVSSALGLGMPTWLSVSAGVIAGWTLIHSSRATWSYCAATILAIAVLLRIAYLNVLPLLPEEAYYWNYAKHIDIGYLDHPPLVAWLIAIGEMLVGHNEAGLRFGSFVNGLITIAFVHGLARRLVDPPSALMAAALAAALPFFFGTGVMMTPDASLMCAWSAAVYFFHGALVMSRRTDWLAAGVAMGVGLLSKYTIALLGPAALTFVLLDQRSRHWLTRWEPYAAAAIALCLFAPVIVWNYQNDWASFLFQARDRFGDERSFSLHVLLMNALVVATPLPLLALPLLFAKRWTSESQATCDPEHAAPRNRLFVICFVCAPLLVFCWSALKHEPRLNWTAPIWLAVLPLLGWTIIHVKELRASLWTATVRHLARPLAASMFMLNAVLLYFIVLGIPGLPYPKSLARTMGWATATEHLRELHDRMTQSTGSAPIVVGMDKYFTAAQLSYHASASQPPMRITAKGVVLGGDGLMFAYWHAPEQFAGRAFIMIARRKAELESAKLAAFFRELDSEIHALALIHDGPGANGQLIDRYHYRIGYDYLPPERARPPSLPQTHQSTQNPPIKPVSLLKIADRVGYCVSASTRRSPCEVTSTARVSRLVNARAIDNAGHSRPKFSRAWRAPTATE
jgi:dolichol-phosphate mannosyltransferase